MKKVLLSILALTTVVFANAQIVVRGVSPAPIANNFDFTWADPGGGDWASPDWNQANTYTEDTLMIVDDGTAGLNAQGNPLSAEGCNPLINDLTGKIAVCYRGTCQFGTKALNAQNAGAEGVIIINRDPEAIGMAGGNDGASVTIPVVMLSSVDGAALVNEMQNGDVVVFMGNKLGLYVNDAGTTKSSCMISKYGSIPKDMGDNGYIFDLGMQFANFGSADNDFYAVAAVTGPSGVLYYDSIAPINMLSGDTSFIFPGNATSFAPMTNSVWDLGFHEVVYSIGIIGQTDEDDWDNSIRSDFYVTNDVLSLAREDASSSVVTNSYPQNHTSSYQACVRIQDVYPNTSTGVEGIYFAPYNSGVSESLDGIYLQGEIYEWDDAWQDVSGGWATVTFDVLSAVGDFDWDGTASTVNGEVVYQELNAPVILNDNQRYLVCLNSFANDSIGFGYDNAPDYNANYAIYQQPIGALNIDGATWYTGWTSADAVSLGLKIAYDVNVVELETIEGIVYPNPAIDNLTISLEKGNGNADLIVYDIAGRLVSSNKVNTKSGLINVDLTKYENGNYIFNLNFEDGKTSNFNVVIVK
jgi:hypothetical protein